MDDELVLGMFKPYDIRTKAQNLSDTLKQRLYAALAVYFRASVKVGSVIICRDARLYVPDLVEGISEAMQKTGIAVLVNPLPISTCQFYYTCMQYQEAAGLMLTASHNPRDYVGIKLMAPHLLPIAFGYGPDGGIEKIRQLYVDSTQPLVSQIRGKRMVVNELDGYVSYSMALAGVAPGDLSGLKVLLEFLSGSAGMEEALAFQKAGADVELRNLVPNGFFPQGDPNPIIERSIAPARKAMRSGSYDLGFCFDGDGDRMDLMDGEGEQIVPGLNMSIIMPKLIALYNGEKKDFYADVKAIPAALCEIAKTGVRVHIIRNGHSFIKAKLRENEKKGYFASEEESAHYYINLPYDINDRTKGYAAVESTLLFALLTARCWKENPEAYQKAREIQESIYREREWPLFFEAAPEKMPQILKKVEDRMRALGAVVEKTMDDGSDLDAVLMRFGLPDNFEGEVSLEGKTWCQIAQRISRSEDAMVRWEVVSNDKGLCSFYNSIIRSIADTYVEAGLAHY